jgi:SAM-dependent methyltransferase
MTADLVDVSSPWPGSSLHALDEEADSASFAELVRMAVARMQPRTVLDVGCGTGVRTLAAAEAGASKVIGIDRLSQNVFEARGRMRRAHLTHRVAVHRASWDDVQTGRFVVGPVDLVVGDLPSLPDGSGVGSETGPTGTRVVEAVIEGAPASAEALALMFGSLCDLPRVFAALANAGFAPTEISMESVPFTAQESDPQTLAHLRALRNEGRAWFCDLAGEEAGHAQLVFGMLVERRGESAKERCEDALGMVLSLLDDYAYCGPDALPGASHHLSFEDAVYSASA